MELKEIREIVAEILSDIHKNKYNLTFRRHETFFDRLGMLQRRNFQLLTRFDNQFKKHQISLWNGKQEVKKVSMFSKGETITFRQEPAADNANLSDAIADGRKVAFQYAGTIHIADSTCGIDPYDHQKDAFYSLQREIIKSNKNSFAGLLVLPTGGGKTLTAAHWISKNILDKGKKVLWVAHRHELLEQAQKTFAEKLAFKDIFENKQSFNYRILSGIHDKPVHIKQTDDLIISSKDSLNAGFDYLHKNWIKNNTDEIFLVIDEAHHATAKTYRKLILNLKNTVSQFRMLGLTATPFRTSEDEKGLLKKVFPDDIVYKIDLRSLIRLGILSEPHFEEVATGQNIIEQFELTEKQVDELNSKFGDFNTILGENISHSIATNKERNLTIVNRYLSQKDKYRQTIVFALNVDNAIALNALFRQAGIKSDYVLSAIKDQATGVTVSSKENQSRIDQFRNEELEVLINVNILTEGIDVPNVQSVFLARPTISSILMTQMIGRGLRGPKARGTKEAFIVSFIDEWQNKITWVNPEKLFIEENVDFSEKTSETNRQLLRLVAINKIEEFAILNNQIIEPQIREELEKLDFISRFPVGIYRFKFLKETDGEPQERACEVLVYDNVQQAYADFVSSLPDLFAKCNLDQKEALEDDELDWYAAAVDEEFFGNCLKYPAYYIQDIKDVLQYYAIQDEAPLFVALKDREKYDIDKIAGEIIDHDLGERAQAEMLNRTWESDEIGWQTFFNYDKKNFLREITMAKLRKLFPEAYSRITVLPKDEKELRDLFSFDLHSIKELDFKTWQKLRDEVLSKSTDSEGNYVCSETGYKSKRLLDFQIDHITSRHNGGFTKPKNLRLVKTIVNLKKGAN